MLYDVYTFCCYPCKQCILLNGLLFVGSIVLLHSALLPLLHSVGGLVLSKGGAHAEVTTLVQRFVQTTVHLLYQVFWITPLYLISVLMNTIWYSRIADASFELHHGVKVSLGVDTTIKEGVYRLLVVLFFILETTIIYELVPFIGHFVSMVLVCWVNALYSFESVWVMQGLDLQKRLAFLER
jgi:etoposide-induced 2.4 mRNA